MLFRAGQPLRATGPDGRAWEVCVVRFRRPPWRSFTVDLEDDLDAFGPLLPVLFFLVALPLGFITVLVLPLLAFIAELPLRGVSALLSTRRWVVAAHRGAIPSQMSWTTSESHAVAVAEQIARQLELGYERIQPHNAVFLGFSSPGRRDS